MAKGKKKGTAGTMKGSKPVIKATKSASGTKSTRGHGY